LEKGACGTGSNLIGVENCDSFFAQVSVGGFAPGVGVGDASGGVSNFDSDTAGAFGIFGTFAQRPMSAAPFGYSTRIRSISLLLHREGMWQ
jgi:hypothetical protein